MDKTYDPKPVEEHIYRMWEEGGYFTPKIVDKKALPAGRQAFSILLPPPNANADLHLGHAMYVIEDIMIRYHRMKGDPTLWLPGADHAGFETQYVFEKHLAKVGKSRFDFDRDMLYRMIWDFVQKNRGAMEEQLRRLGFSLDWTRNTFTLDPNIIEVVYKTFKKLYDDGLVYRGQRLVNYCTRDGTGFSDLEVKHVEQTDPLYFLKYGPLVLATTRPETKFGDTAVAVNPADKRYKEWIGKDIEVNGLLGPFKIRVVGDEAVDPTFGTGVVKVTPAHDHTDWEIGHRHNLEMKQVIGFDGRLTELAGPYAGLKVKVAREKVVADLQAKDLIDHIDEQYTHTVAICYKCGNVLEPLPLAQWFVKVKPLTDAAKKAIKDKKIVFIPKRFEKLVLRWLTDFHDWNISRQIVWGIRIPAWQCKDCEKQYVIGDMQNKNVSHLTSHVSPWIITDGKKPKKCPRCGGINLEQDTDTFDTWFSSGQWPFATLMASDKQYVIRDMQNKNVSHLTSHVSPDFQYFYPTSVMETGYDILPWWVCRMIMLGLYATGNVPFRAVYLHGLVRDSKGQKMSKSRGNVINPLTMADTYGTDALRMALVYEMGAGNDMSISEDKIRGMRNFANKLWNIGRFITLSNENDKTTKTTKKMDKEVTKSIAQLVKMVTKNLDSYQFGQAAKFLYEFTWHTFADTYVEQYKKGEISYRVLLDSFIVILTLLHPFMPFVTEAIWDNLPKEPNGPLIVSSWPS